MSSVARLAVSAGVALCALPLLVFGARTTRAAWEVFPPLELNPCPPADSALATVVGLAPADAHYRFFAAIALSEHFHGAWLTDDAIELGERAATFAVAAAKRMPTNPFFQRMAGRLLLEVAAHPQVPPGARALKVQEAMERFRLALEAWPRSPMIHRLVGRDLIENWHVLPAAGRDLGLEALRVAGELNLRRLGGILSVVWSRAVLPSATRVESPDIDDLLRPLEALGRTPETIAKITGFVRRRARELPGLDPEDLSRWIAQFQPSDATP